MNCCITEFGASPGSKALQTAAIQKAIDACKAAGGGKVVVPTGLFRTGTLFLCSDLELHLESGAVLLGPERIEDYTPIDFPWTLYPCTYSLIYAENCRNIRIAGAGEIDFNARCFADTGSLCLGTDLLEKLSPDQRADVHYEMPARDRRPSRLVFFNSCTNVDVSGIALSDSPTWTLVFSRCRRVRCADLNITNDMRIPNNDGIHCCGCQEVIVANCFISAGDDCIALTAISDGAAPVGQVTVSNCVFRSASAAVRIGFMDAKVRDVCLNNIVIHDSNRGVGIFAGEGGSVTNVCISNLTVKSRIYCGPWWGKGEPLVLCAVEPDSHIDHVQVSNCRFDSENSIVAVGNIRNLHLDHIDMTLSYGTNRPLFGAELDLSPHPNRPAPDATRHIPWLHSDGAEIDFQRVAVDRKPGEGTVFGTKELVK